MILTVNIWGKDVTLTTREHDVPKMNPRIEAPSCKAANCRNEMHTAAVVVRRMAASYDGEGISGHWL